MTSGYQTTDCQTKYTQALPSVAFVFSNTSLSDVYFLFILLLVKKIKYEKTEDYSDTNHNTLKLEPAI